LLSYAREKKKAPQDTCEALILVVPGDGIEPPTRGFSIMCPIRIVIQNRHVNLWFL